MRRPRQSPCQTIAKVSARRHVVDHNYCATDPFTHQDDEATIKVASKKNPSSSKMKGHVFKVKDRNPKVKEAGDYERGTIAEGACAQHLVPILFRSFDFLNPLMRSY